MLAKRAKNDPGTDGAGHLSIDSGELLQLSSSTCNVCVQGGFTHPDGSGDLVAGHVRRIEELHCPSDLLGDA